MYTARTTRVANSKQNARKRARRSAKEREAGWLARWWTPSAEGGRASRARALNEVESTASTEVVGWRADAQRYNAQRCAHSSVVVALRGVAIQQDAPYTDEANHDRGGQPVIRQFHTSVENGERAEGIPEPHAERGVTTAGRRRGKSSWGVARTTWPVGLRWVCVE